MTHSFEEMKTLCLDLAEDAGPIEAGALRELADNYEAAIDDSQFERKIPERWIRRMETVATWWIVLIVVGFPVLKIGTFLVFRPEGTQHSLMAERALAVWRWLAAWF